MMDILIGLELVALCLVFTAVGLSLVAKLTGLIP